MFNTGIDWLLGFQQFQNRSHMHSLVALVRLGFFWTFCMICLQGCHPVSPNVITERESPRIGARQPIDAHVAADAEVQTASQPSEPIQHVLNDDRGMQQLTWVLERTFRPTLVSMLAIFSRRDATINRERPGDPPASTTNRLAYPPLPSDLLSSAHLPGFTHSFYLPHAPIGSIFQPVYNPISGLCPVGVSCPRPVGGVRR